MVVMLQFCFVFVHHCDVLFVLSQLHYVVTFFDDVRITFYFGTLKLRMEVML